MTDSQDPWAVERHSLESDLSFDLALATGHGLSIYSPQVLNNFGHGSVKHWLVGTGMLGGVVEVKAPAAAWGAVQDMAATLPASLWPSLMKRQLPKVAWELLVDELGMPGAISRSRSIVDPQAVSDWVAWNQEALRHQMIFECSTAPSEDVLHASDLAVEVGLRFHEEAVSFLALPAEYDVRLGAEELSSIIWRLAEATHDLDVADLRRDSLIHTAGLRTEEDYEDLRTLAWRGNQDAKVVLAALERLDAEDEAGYLRVTDLAAELEFTVRDRRMVRKQAALERAKRLAETLLPAA